MARYNIVWSLVLAFGICQALTGAVPEQVFGAEVRAAGDTRPGEQVKTVSEPKEPQFSIRDALKELWDSLDPSSGSSGSSSERPPLSDHDKYEMLKSLHVARDVSGDRCNRSALANLNNLADVSAHLYSESVNDYVLFYRSRQFKLCKGPALEALRELLAEDEAQVEGDGENRRLEGIVDLGERIRRQGVKLFGSKETRRALLMYLQEKDLHPLESSGGDKTTFYISMDHLLDKMCRGTLEPRVEDTLDVLEQLHADHSLTWDEFLPNQINFIVGSIACRDIFEDKQAYLAHLYTVSVSGDGAGF